MTRCLAILSLAWCIFTAADASAQLFGQRSVGQPLSQRNATSQNATSQNSRSQNGGSRNATSRTAATRNSGTSATAANRAPGAVGGNAGVGDGAGVINENARFIRGNRDAEDFVGAARRESQQFVGRQESGIAAEDIQSAVDELRVETGPDANRAVQPRMPARVRMYAPRLKIGFDPLPGTTNGPATAGRIAEDRIEDGRTADGQAATGQVVDLAFSALVTRRVLTTLPLSSPNQIEVLVAGRAAILRGAVASAREQKLAELLLQLEPGIERVENQLQIQPAGPTPLPLQNPGSPD